MMEVSNKYGLFRLLLGNVPSAVERVSVASGSCRLPRNYIYSIG